LFVISPIERKVLHTHLLPQVGYAPAHSVDDVTHLVGEDELDILTSCLYYLRCELITHKQTVLDLYWAECEIELQLRGELMVRSWPTSRLCRHYNQ